jgi:hypothetical protein
MVRSGSGDKVGALAGDGRVGPAGVSPSPPPRNYVTSTPSPGERMCRGRFWALAELEEEPEAVVEDTSDGDPVLDGEIQRSAAPPPSRSISLGDFISRAEELGGSFRHGKRAAFAPGSRGSRFQGGPPAARFSRLGDDGWVVHGRRRAVLLPVSVSRPSPGPPPAVPPRPPRAAPEREVTATPPKMVVPDGQVLGPPWSWGWSTRASASARPSAGLWFRCVLLGPVLLLGLFWSGAPMG